MRSLAFLVLLAAHLAACGERSVVEPGELARSAAALRFGLSSYSTRAEVEQLLGGPLPQLIEDSPTPARISCPRFDQLSLSFSDRRDLDHPGELRVQFINGQLHTIVFYPDDYESYASALTQAGTSLDSQGGFRPSTDVRGWTYTAFDGRRYVAWEDARMAKEVRDWIAACS